MLITARYKDFLLSIFYFSRICKDSTNLKYLDIRNYKSASNRNLNFFQLINSNKLEHLYLCNSNLNEADNMYLAEAIENKWRSTLVELDISWSNLNKHCLESILNSLSFESSRLKTLNLSGTCVETQMIK